MKKLFICLAVAGIIGTTAATPALACEGGKCKMEHKDSDKASKTKKGKKQAAKGESCHVTTAAASTAATTSVETKSCCMKKDASKAEKPKE